MKFTKPFLGVKAGEVYPTEFKPGDECPPELQDAAKSVGAVEGKAAPAPAAKRGKQGGA